MRTALIAAAALAALPTAALAESDVTVAPFHTVGLSEGGTVVVRYGAQQRIHVLEGSEQYTRFRVRDGNLEIESCPRDVRCPMQYTLRVEITVPALTALAVSEGRSWRAEGAFPAQQAVSAAVNEGGIVDIRAVSARDVRAAVNEGGRVLVTATGSLKAAVNGGGHIAYWGNPSSIHRAISNGGAITPGDGAAATAMTTPRHVEVHEVRRGHQVVIVRHDPDEDGSYADSEGDDDVDSDDVDDSDYDEDDDSDDDN